MISILTRELIQELLSVKRAPCFSLYMPTHRSHPEKIQDPIRFKNLVKILEASFLKQYSADEKNKVLEPLKTLGNNNEFWNHTSDGLAVLGSTDLFKVIKLPVAVEEQVVVADSLHTKPLLQYMQSADRYHILGLSLHEIRLYEGNRYSLFEVELQPEIPKTITEALGEELTERHSHLASYGGMVGESSDMHQGHGGKKEEEGKDTRRFFSIIANTIYQNYSKPTDLPLIIAALPEHHRLFHKVSKNPLLLAEGISVNPATVSIDKLKKLAWEVYEPIYLQKLTSLVDKFEQAKANNSGSDNIKEIEKAAAAGRVETILIEADRTVSKRLRNKNTGIFIKADLSQPKSDDLLDDIAEMVIKMGGKVIFIPKVEMPSKTGISALFRY
jgi:hypothetical protein